ncbi:hypothetical protein PAXINDRAFT_103530, partial [Paxillus involutus ATCC 200175]
MVEPGPYKEYDPESDALGAHNDHASERVGLLSGSPHSLSAPNANEVDAGDHLNRVVGAGMTVPRFTLPHLLASFTGGVIVCLAVQLSVFGMGCYSFGGEKGSGTTSGDRGGVDVYAPPWVGSTIVHNYPPPSPTNDFPELFPTDVGYPGGTPTGAEPALIVTAPSQPLQTGAAQLVAPAYTVLPKGPSQPKPSMPRERPFNLFRSWGNLSPWYSVPRGAFGIDEGPEPPEECEIMGLHVLHR